MLTTYFKTAWRNLLKNKSFSVINISGLAIGIAAFLLIINYLRFEYSFDKFNVNKDRIYRVPMVVSETNGKPQTFAFTYPALAPAMKKDFPEVQETVRFRIRWGVVQQGDKKIVENGNVFYVDPSIFKVFSFQFEKGTPATAFTQLNDAVITHETAEKYFGNEDPLGKTLSFDNENYVVKAVLKNIPASSHLQFHILLNYDKYIATTNGRANTAWGWSDFYTYLLLKPGTDVKLLQQKLPAFAQRYKGDDMKKNGYTCSFVLQPLDEIHAKSTFNYEFSGSGNLYYLRYLGYAAVFILLIALINYINLSTAHSLERSKEVGVRKVIGATKYQLVKQFLAETFVMNLFGIGLGFLLFKLTLTPFAILLNRNVADLQTATWQFWVTIFGVFITSTLLAGFYPALMLSSFRPMQTLKSAAGSAGIQKSSGFFRKSLVVLQFVAAIILIGGAIGFYRQLNFMSNRSLGIDIRQTLVLQQTLSLDSSKSRSVEAIINQLKQVPGVESVTASTDIPGGEVGNSSGFRLLSSKDDKRCRTFGIDEHFIPNFGLTLLAGRNFDRDKAARVDTSQPLSIIINETAAQTFGFNDPSAAINQIVIGGDATCKIIGVMNNYHQQSLQYNFDPIIYYPEQNFNMTSFSVKFHTQDVNKMVERAKATWNAVFPQSPLQFFFLDEYFNRQYNNDKLFSTILWWFTLIAVIVSSLGLFGLSLYTVAKRFKEIGIRKVLGASIVQIITLITKDYIKLILLAGVVAIPVSYFVLQDWLKDYAFHISIGFWFFILPIALILIIALITVLFQSLKAAITNPVKILRSE